MNQSNIRRLTNTNLRAFAVLEAQLTKGLDSPSDYLIPFFQAEAEAHPGTPFSLDLVIGQIEENYSLNVPLYLAESLVSKLNALGSIEFDDLLQCYICKSTQLNEDSLTLTQSDFDQLEHRLINYSLRLGYQGPIASSDWIKGLFDFFANKDDSNSFAPVKGVIISNVKSRDNWVISKFITDAELGDPNIYSLIKRIYAAYSIADTVTQIQNVGYEQEWEGMCVFYDSTVLMRLLGTSGSLLKKATFQLHNLLLDMGCRTYYFEHNLSEVFQNLEAISRSHSGGGNIHPETAQAFEEREITPASINLLLGGADAKLGQLSITRYDMPNRLTTNNLQNQIDLAGAQRFLKANIAYHGSGLAAAIDADSLDHVLFLRKGKTNSDIPSSKYIFVTHNQKYARVTRKYCIDKCGYSNYTAPPIITLNTLTKLAWLASDKSTYPAQISNDLAINCFQASLPDSKWFDKFWSTIRDTRPDLIDQNTAESFYLTDVRKAIEEETFGSSKLFSEDFDIGKIIERAKQKRIDDDKKHLSEIEELKETAEKAIEEKETERQNALKEASAQKDNELEEVKKSHNDELKASALQVKYDSDREIEINISNNAERQATFYIRVLTFITIILACYACYQGSEKNAPVLLQSVFWVLSLMQIVGLFIPNFSFVFLGKMLKKRLARYFASHHRKMISHKK